MLTSEDQRFADLRSPRRIWAVGAVHGEVERLETVHSEVGRRFTPGDRLVYLGNMVGRGPAVAETVDELLAFRLALLSVPGMKAEDVVYLRGAQEEMWQKLLQLQFAPNPAQVLAWMLNQGLGATLAAYGGNAEVGLRSAREGAVSLTRWTNGLRAAIRAHPGHENLMSALRRAAFTSMPVSGQPGSADGAPPDGAPNARVPAGILLVHSGIDTSRPLGAQGDSFWWGGSGFHRISDPYGTFHRIVRGFDPANGGVVVTDHTATIDAGCGLGGRLACACIDPSGNVTEIIEA
ncbi:MAG TPA: hypothetical protein VK943_06205 [Arenibaculum sp.]|nr:hypothetical protein [Arenibaculum sp.]